MNTDGIWTLVADRDCGTAFGAAVRTRKQRGAQFPLQSKSGNRTSFASEKYLCLSGFICG